MSVHDAGRVPYRWVVNPTLYRDIVKRYGEEYAAAHFLAWEYIPTAQTTTPATPDVPE